MSTRVVVDVLVGVILGFCAGVVLMDLHRPAPATDTLRDLCVELATQTRYPTLYIDGRGCVIFVNNIEGDPT